MRRSIAFASLSVLVALGLGAAAGAAADDAPSRAKTTAAETAAKAKTEVNDSWLTLKTKMALLADARVRSRDVHVTTQHGTVTLRGKVESAGARQAAAEDARKLDGVTQVRNELTVVPQSARAAVDRQDGQIVQDIETQFQADARLKQADLSVRADKGIVTLTGKAPSLETSVHASEVAHRVAGVRAVRNEVALERKG